MTGPCGTIPVVIQPLSPSLFQAFLYKALGTALSTAGDAEGVTLQLQDLLLRADYTDEAQREVRTTAGVLEVGLHLPCASQLSPTSPLSLLLTGIGYTRCSEGTEILKATRRRFGS